MPGRAGCTPRPRCALSLILVDSPSWTRNSFRVGPWHAFAHRCCREWPATRDPRLLGGSFLLHHDYLALRVWSVLPLAAGLGPPLITLYSELTHRVAQRGLPRAPADTARGRAPARWTVSYDTNAIHSGHSGRRSRDLVAVASGSAAVPLRAPPLKPGPRVGGRQVRRLSLRRDRRQRDAAHRVLGAVRLPPGQRQRLPARVSALGHRRRYLRQLHPILGDGRGRPAVPRRDPVRTRDERLLVPLVRAVQR